jgi:hypothetical protein
MTISIAQFRHEYLHAAHELGAPIPGDALISEDYEAYVYGTSLIAGKAATVRFFKDDAGGISWDVGPAQK